MSKAIGISRHSTVNRTATPERRVVVPDRMIVRHTKGISPIINSQSSTMVAPVVQKKQPKARHQPIASSKVHATAQKKDYSKQGVRPVKRGVEVSMVDAMSSMLARRNALPKHLARTAGRAHLLSQIVQPEPAKQRWHQKVFASLMS